MLLNSTAGIEKLFVNRNILLFIMFPFHRQTVYKDMCKHFCQKVKGIAFFLNMVYKKILDKDDGPFA